MILVKSNTNISKQMFLLAKVFKVEILPELSHLVFIRYWGERKCSALVTYSLNVCAHEGGDQINQLFPEYVEGAILCLFFPMFRSAFCFKTYVGLRIQSLSIET